MAVEDYVQIVVPGDEPVQIAGSPHLERLAGYGDVTLYDTRPESSEEGRKGKGRRCDYEHARCCDVGRSRV